MSGSPRPLRVGVVGVGYFGRLHASKFAQMSGAELAAVADIDSERASAVAADLGVEALGDYRALMDRVDAVSIAVPTARHFEIASEFLKAGVHVFVEKPITGTIEDARALVARAAAKELTLQVGHIERFGGLYKALKEVIKRPLFIEAVRIAPFKDRGTDVSVVLDVMIHDIDLILGLVDSPVTTVEALGAPVFAPTDDIANARIKFASGCVANLTASRISLKQERRMRFFQQDCYLAVDFDQKSLRIVRRNKSASPLPVDLKDVKYEEGDALFSELESFVACVRERGVPAVTGADGEAALATALTISRSLRDHRRFIEETGLLEATP